MRATYRDLLGNAPAGDPFEDYENIKQEYKQEDITPGTGRSPFHPSTWTSELPSSRPRPQEFANGVSDLLYESLRNRLDAPMKIADMKMKIGVKKMNKMLNKDFTAEKAIIGKKLDLALSIKKLKYNNDIDKMVDNAEIAEMKSRVPRIPGMSRIFGGSGLGILGGLGLGNFGWGSLEHVGKKKTTKRRKKTASYWGKIRRSRGFARAGSRANPFIIDEGPTYRKSPLIKQSTARGKENYYYEVKKRVKC